MNTLNTIADWALLAASPAPPIFVLMYLRSPWNRTTPGRALMAVTASLTLVVLIVLSSLFFGTDYPGRAFVRLVGYSMLAVAMWGMVITLWRVQRKGNDVNQFRRDMAKKQ